MGKVSFSWVYIHSKVALLGPVTCEELLHVCFFACGYSVVLVPSVKILRCFKDKIWGLKS